MRAVLKERQLALGRHALHQGFDVGGQGAADLWTVWRERGGVWWWREEEWMSVVCSSTGKGGRKEGREGGREGGSEGVRERGRERGKEGRERG